MNTLKKIGLFLAVPLLSLSIFMGVSLWSLQQYFGDSTHLKQWLEESKVYPAISKEIVAQSVKAAKEQTNNDALNFSSPVIKKALEKALTVTYVQSAVEELVDGTYAWLDGTNPKPTYNIDVDPLKRAFADSVIGSAEKRLDKLPDCVLPDQATTTDPFKTNCSPPLGISQTELKKLRREIEKNKDFLPQDITADTTNFGEATTGEGSTAPEIQPWYQSVAHWPGVFQWMQRGPLIALGVGLLSVTGIIFLSSTRRQGLRRTAITLLGSSVALALSSILLMFATRFIKTPVTDQDSHLYDPLLSVVRLATNAVNHWQLITCLVIAVIGLVTLIVLRLTRPTQQPAKQGTAKS